jgi:hypothetical protein
MSDQHNDESEARRRAIIERITRNPTIMARVRASRASYERGEPAIPFSRVRAEAEARNRRA